ncbi:MAG: hypothetical protein FD163_2033 [Hyphomonadaceae bacterium]|nr:MAG: hypothetical protein FD163_2033 [Hyphomonadaceae bacterium]
MTQWELRLWGKLRRSGFGVRFHRQEPIGNYIADFACRKAWLIIEADGEHHTYDNRDYFRDKWLNSQGWQILRFTNHQIQWSLDDVLTSIQFSVDEQLKSKLKPASRANYFPK